MLEFLPWSRKTLNECLNKYKNERKLCILDIELGGACNFRCEYCDTPAYEKDIKYDIAKIKEFIIQGSIKWIFICGLGEPTVGPNLKYLKSILQFCYENNVKCCMFSNIANFDEELFDYVGKEVLYPMFKLDTFDLYKIKQIYNVSDKLASMQLNNAASMPKYVRKQGEYTNVCASIVPSNLNAEELNEIVTWCYKHDIFPLIGDLEDAGKGSEIYNSLKVTDIKLEMLKRHIYNLTGENYQIPICPSVLFGLHIGYDGSVLVDGYSGLSCHWFWLTEPNIQKLGHINDYTFDEISNLVLENRLKYKEKVRELAQNQKKLVFGGCGGDIVDLLCFYLEKM